MHQQNDANYIPLMSQELQAYIIFQLLSSPAASNCFPILSTVSGFSLVYFHPSQGLLFTAPDLTIFLEVEMVLQDPVGPIVN